MTKPTQEQWDKILVECFYKHKEAPMWRLVDGDLDKYSHLLRVPDLYHLNMNVTEYVCSILPKLGKILWDTDESKMPNIIKALGKSKLDKLKIKRANTPREEKLARQAEQRQFRVLGAERGSSRRHASKMNGTDWHTCK